MKNFLLGSVVGDIVGSRWEWAKPETISPQFKFITKTSRYTDDTVLTMAVAEALLKDRPFDMMIQHFARRYPNRGYGCMFRKWTYNNGERVTYNSYGNGSAMRLLPIPLFFNDLTQVLRFAVKQSACTHNHEDSLDASMLLAHTIFLARSVKSKSDIYKTISKRYEYEYKEPGDEETRKHSLHSITGVHEALNAFFKGSDFVSVLRESIKYGGDSDTIAACSCAIAYVFYEKIPQDLIDRVWLMLPEQFRQIIMTFAEITEGKQTIINSKKLF